MEKYRIFITESYRLHPTLFRITLQDFSRKKDNETISMNYDGDFVEILRDDTKTYSITYSTQELKKALE